MAGEERACFPLSSKSNCPWRSRIRVWPGQGFLWGRTRRPRPARARPVPPLSRHACHAHRPRRAGDGCQSPGWTPGGPWRGKGCAGGLVCRGTEGEGARPFSLALPSSPPLTRTRRPLPNNHLHTPPLHHDLHHLHPPVRVCVRVRGERAGGGHTQGGTGLVVVARRRRARARARALAARRLVSARALPFPLGRLPAYARRPPRGQGAGASRRGGGGERRGARGRVPRGAKARARVSQMRARSTNTAAAAAVAALARRRAPLFFFSLPHVSSFFFFAPRHTAPRPWPSSPPPPPAPPPPRTPPSPPPSRAPPARPPTTPTLPRCSRRS